MYENLIKPKVDKLKDAEGKGKDKRTNILNILKNIKPSIFDGIYLDYFDKSEIAEESVAKRTKLKRQRLKVIEDKKQKINNGLFIYYFDYSSPDNMHSRLSDALVATNKNEAYLINEKLTKLNNIVKNVPKNKAFKIEKNEKIIDIAERILELNSENQSGLGLTILTQNQMLRRFPITLAQLKAGNNSEKFKNEMRQILYSLYRSKKLTINVCNNLINTI